MELNFRRVSPEDWIGFEYRRRAESLCNRRSDEYRMFGGWQCVFTCISSHRSAMEGYSIDVPYAQEVPRRINIIIIISMIMFQLFSSTHVFCSLPSADSRSPFCLFRACLRFQVPYSKEIGWGKCHGQLVSLVLSCSLLDGCLVPLSGLCVICNVPCIIRRRTALM